MAALKIGKVPKGEFAFALRAASDGEKRFRLTQQRNGGSRVHGALRAERPGGERLSGRGRVAHLHGHHHAGDPRQPHVDLPAAQPEQPADGHHPHHRLEEHHERRIGATWGYARGSRYRSHMAKDIADLGLELGTGRPELDQLIAEVAEHHPEVDGDALRRAYAFAEERHRTQLRYSGEPFITHPLGCARICAGLGLDGTAVMAALLHDTVEDTGATLEDIERELRAPRSRRSWTGSPSSRRSTSRARRSTRPRTTAS